MIIGCKLATTEYGAETFFQSQLVEFCENLTGFDSGHKSLPDTRQISSDIGNFFAHVYKAKIRWISFFNQDNLKSFVDKLLNSNRD